MFRVFLLLFLTCFILSTNPLFASPTDELAKTKKEAAQAKARSSKLEADAKALAKKREELAAQMVKTASALQLSEARLSAIEEKMRILNEQIDEKTEKLIAHKKELAVMVQASLKLSETPPEAIIVMPGDMMDNMKASRELKMTSDSIKVQSENIRLQMAELAALKEKVSKSKEDAVDENEKLTEQKKLLKKQVDEHNALIAKLDIAQKAEKARMQNLAKKASDLQEFISALENEKQQSTKPTTGEDIASDESPPSGEKGSLRSFKKAKGHIRVPVAGKLIQRFGVESRNETSKGITIQTREDAQVTSPYDAEVLFTGPFMEYGKVIILRHSDGFHTLLAGISKIDVSVGEFLLEGEPIGAMGDGDNNRLYMEMRSDNQPIDPANWIRSFNK